MTWSTEQAQDEQHRVQDIAIHKQLWTMQNGDTIIIEDMEDSHVRNCIKYFGRKLDELPYPCFNGDMAQMYAEQEYDRYNNKYARIITVFKNELERRGLTE